MQAMKKTSFYQFILPKVEEQYLKLLEEEEEEDVKPVILGGKIVEGGGWNKKSRGVMIPRNEVEIRGGRLKELHLFPWEIKKTLSNVDVDRYGKIEGLRLSGEQVENHILKHWEEEELKFDNFLGAVILKPLVIHDLDTNTLHSMVLCKREWDAFYMYTIQNSWLEDFVMRRRLSQGTLIGMYWDIKRSHLCFSVLESPLF